MAWEKYHIKVATLVKIAIYLKSGKTTTDVGPGFMGFTTGACPWFCLAAGCWLRLKPSMYLRKASLIKSERVRCSHPAMKSTCSNNPLGRATSTLFGMPDPFQQRKTTTTENFLTLVINQILLHTPLFESSQ
jgi:hypothetical protein